MNNSSVMIIGAGLSGLYLAHRLGQQGYTITLLEARERIGGRILSQGINADPSAAVDLGPAWVWPQFQPRLTQLLSELNLMVFPQFTSGDSLFQMPDGRIERHANPSAHAESYRMVGGAQALVERLLEQTSATLHLNTRVQTIDAVSKTVTAMQGNEERSFSADRVVSTLPLRLLADTVAIQPGIEAGVFRQWQTVPTWMAAHCKMVFVYGSPYWRELGLSGEVFSHRGPLSEVYDGSPYAGDAYALTAFVGLNAEQRDTVSESQLIEACLSQLEGLFGAQARSVQEVIVKDWSREALTATPSDLSGPHRHPEYPAHSPRQFFEGYLHIAGTETALEYGGYIEGALESADAILQGLGCVSL